MASIYRYYDGLGRGEFLSRASHPSGKIKKEKAEIFSFHQNRKELGEVGDGRRDEGWRLRCALQPVVVLGEGSPPAGHLHAGPRGTRTGTACPPCGHPWLPQAFVSSLTPRPMCLRGPTTQMLICTRPVSPWSPLTPESHAHPRNPLQIPREKRSSSGWMGLGEGSAFLTFIFPSP